MNFWRWYRRYCDVVSRLEKIDTKQDIIIKLERIIMSKADDLRSAIADLKSQLTANNAEIEVLLNKIAAPGTPDAEVDDAISQIRTLIADNKAEVDKAAAT